MTKAIDYFTQSVTWHDVEEKDYCFAAELKGQPLRLRLNDFPKEPMYTLFVNDFEVCDFNDWPQRWRWPQSSDSKPFLLAPDE